ncbi:Retrotransposon protein [Nesidiocoris tenuis]|uniref:Retrotransposon protein n=1 Tax=Nesidiocoris tenuis TaxID=355587 RepID=A0ABN7APX5_9HEMI|nr:Retrotransposon protein [Nesidiocoris tenuis]
MVEVDNYIDLYDVPPIEDIPIDIRPILGENPDYKKTIDFSLHESIASRWADIFKNGIQTETFSEILGQYVVPTNLKSLSPPRVDPEVVPILPRHHVTRDNAYMELQKTIGIGLVALGSALNHFLDDKIDLTAKKEKIVSDLRNSGRVFSQTFRSITTSRRNLILPNLKISENLKHEVAKMDSTDFLFGGKLVELFKSEKQLESVAQELKAAPASQAPFKGRQPNHRGGGWRRSEAYPLNQKRPARSAGGARPYKGQPYKYPTYRKEQQVRPKARVQTHSKGYQNRQPPK